MKNTIAIVVGSLVVVAALLAAVLVPVAEQNYCCHMEQEFAVCECCFP